MENLLEIRLVIGSYDKVMNGEVPTIEVGDDSWINERDGASSDEAEGGKAVGKRIRLVGGKYWDVILHVLPKGARYQWKWPEGSWTILQPLTGLAEVAQLRGPDRNGFYTKMRTRDLRGGGDGSTFGSMGSHVSREDEKPYSTAGENCVKYLGGPLRSYTGKAMKSTILEVVIRPPITTLDEDIKATGIVEELNADSVGDILARVKKKDYAVDGEKVEFVAELTVVEGQSAGTDNTNATNLNKKLGMEFENVGGLDAQLDDIARRVLASRANPQAARRLGVSHVRGILLSGPPGCGKTLMARELSRLLGAREPQIVNGPEILDKFIGEAERRVRELFLPAEREYEEVGEESQLHLIVLDELDSIARKRGSMTSDTTGVRDSVVNQLLAKIDGVKEAPNILVVGMTNRPELIDPALLRPGRLEVQLRVELPNRVGRRDILRIHTRRMKKEGVLSDNAIALLEDLSDDGMGARTEYFSGAELAGLVRSASSFALARAVTGDDSSGMVVADDLERALKEVRPALGTQDEVLKMRFPFGISDYSASMKRIMRDLNRFTAPIVSSTPRLSSLLVVGSGCGGSGATALAAWAAAEASIHGRADYVRFITALDILTAEGNGGDEARATALVEKFAEAREMSHSLLVLDDIDQICAGSGLGGYSSVMISTLRALLRTPPPSTNAAKPGGQLVSSRGIGKTLQIIAATSRSDAACVTLNELFEETIVVPLLSDPISVQKLLAESLTDEIADVESFSKLIIQRLGKVGCKTALRLSERAVFTAGIQTQQMEIHDKQAAQLRALDEILCDYSEDEASRMCDVA